ncbi:MAG TPA: CDP-diacylglycerol--glycerol-3-phosphate 3-phosphatidyltransferase [Acidimicrobiales bacterium]|nr:CDP-diacylglycerol--glycerol-3-phosphate 3-phosphatidyltransferase [Acidimicrobiales bacterium]
MKPPAGERDVTIGGAPLGGGPLGGAPIGGAPIGGTAPAVAPVRAIGYGPTALATPANALTLMRLLAAPLLVIMVLQRPTSWLTWAVWTALAGTDGIDGWLARRHGTTRSGAFLDPLADKFLVLGAMYALVATDHFSWIPVTIIAVREVAISLYRVVAAREGVSVPAKVLAKIKTLIQALAVGSVVWPVTGHHPLIAVILLWLGVVLTVVTGIQYLLAARAPADDSLPAPTGTTQA